MSVCARQHAFPILLMIIYAGFEDVANFCGLVILHSSQFWFQPGG